MKKGFFTFANFATAALILGMIVSTASAADTVLESPAPAAPAAPTAAQPAVAESAPAPVAESAPAPAQAEAAPVYYETAQNPITIGGFIYSTWYDGFYPMNGDNNLAVNQTVLFMKKDLNTAGYGTDWGFNVTGLYGTEHGQFADDGFDGKWGTSGDGYGASLYECYGALGWGNTSLKIGKFATPLGYESAVGPVRDLNSTSYIHGHHPAVFAGGLLTWNATDRLALNGGFTKGTNNSFDKDGDYGFLFGAEFKWNPCMTISYEGMINHVENDNVANGTEYMHSVLLTWDLSCRTQYVFETSYGSVYDVDAQERTSDFIGFANYLKYKLYENVTAITRFEWFKENGEDSYTELTFGIKYNVTDHFMLRPEIRYDWVDAGGSKDNGFSGGIGGAFLF